jgi:glycosyltransferase involved in cell wall biosynthesis
MRILFVAPNIALPGANGGSTHVTEVVAALRERHEVLVLARRGSSAPGSIGIGGKLAPGPLRYLLPLTQLGKAYRAAKEFRPDAIYERFSAFGLGTLLGKLLRVPVVAMVLDRSATHTTYAGADRLITTAPQLVPERYRDKVRRVTWGANADRFRPDIAAEPLRTQLGFAAEDFVLGYAGAFYPWHGLDDLVGQLADLAKQEPNLKALLVGDGQTRSAIEQRVQALGLRERVLFTGRVQYERVPEYLAVCDACTAHYDPSRHAELRRQGMFFDPLKVFEYLAMGKPTVTLDTTNMRELFEHERHALLVPPGDRARFAEALLRLMHDPALRQRLAEQGRALVVDHYSWRAHAAQLTQLFEELLEEEAARAPGH